ncbi:hypothetical protein BC826DRAFT_212678 [Russula brevipes]|nr:hypothetical protein BC826DRAFT_212678 [Russula brevipes]
MLKWGARWMVWMVIGAYTLAIGIGCRLGLHVKPESRGIYITEYSLVTLSPCAFIAADYVLLGRLARYLGSGSEKHILVAPNRITITFIISDVITFLIQSTGGAVSVGANTTKGVKLVWMFHHETGGTATGVRSLLHLVSAAPIRSFYRVVELSQGYRGPIARTKNFSTG